MESIHLAIEPTSAIFITFPTEIRTAAILNHPPDIVHCPKSRQHLNVQQRAENYILHFFMRLQSFLFNEQWDFFFKHSLSPICRLMVNSEDSEAVKYASVSPFCDTLFLTLFRQTISLHRVHYAILKSETFLVIIFVPLSSFVACVSNVKKRNSALFLLDLKGKWPQKLLPFKR